MATIDFCWREYLERDVSLLEETAAPNILMKYVYPDSLLDKLPKSVHRVCLHITAEIKRQHGNLFCEEELPKLYPNGTRTVKFKNMFEFIKSSLHRLLRSENKPWHPLFPGGMITVVAGFFREIVTTPPDQTISVDMKRLWRPTGKRWGDLSEDLMSEVLDSQAKFLFHYFVSYLRKFVMCSPKGAGHVLLLRPMEDVMLSFSQRNVKRLMSVFVKVPTLSHFSLNDDRCILRKCGTNTIRQIARFIFGIRVFDGLNSPSQFVAEHMVTEFVKKHKKLCKNLATAEWLQLVPDQKLSYSLGVLLDKLAAVHYTSMPSLYTRFNLEAAGRELLKAFRLKSVVTGDKIFESVSVDFNPEPLSFIDSLGEHLTPFWQKRVGQYQQALFYNSLFFYYFYVIHWIRRFAHFVPSVVQGTRGYQLRLRDHAEAKQLLEQPHTWAEMASEQGNLETTGCQEAEDEPADWQDDEAPSTSGIEEPEIDFPRVSTATKKAEENSSGAEKGGEEAESPGRKPTLKEKKKKKKNCDEEVAESQESGEKRKRNHSDHEEMEVVEPAEVPADSKEDPTTPRAKKKKRNSEPIEVVTLSSDDEAELSLHQWEAKWMAQLNRLSADPSVPSMACLTLQTVFENSKRIRLELKNLEG